MNIALINFLNSIPYVYAIQLQQHLFNKIYLVPPSEGADLFLKHKVDVALLPIASLIHANNIYRFPYGIGSKKAVKTVILALRKPLHHVQTILLDKNSRTSNALTQILCHFHWKIFPRFTFNEQESFDARVIIGDTAFLFLAQAKQTIDLAQAWYEFTNTPMVFARWIARSDLETSKIHTLLRIFEQAIFQKQESIALQHILPENEALDYLNNNIVYHLNSDFEEGEKLFLTYLQKITR